MKIPIKFLQILLGKNINDDMPAHKQLKRMIYRRLWQHKIAEMYAERRGKN